MAPEIKHQWMRMKAAVASTGISQSKLASLARVDQASVSRILGRCPRRAGSAFKKLCKYAGTISAVATKDPASSEKLMGALRDVWNGTDEHADALAALIRASGYAAQVGAI